MSSLCMTEKKSYILLAPGMEIAEAAVITRVLRLSGMHVAEIAVNDTPVVESASGQRVVADMLLNGTDLTGAEWLLLPGGGEAAIALRRDIRVRTALMAHADRNGRIAAICAAPALTLAPIGILKGRKATCYPTLRNFLSRGGAQYTGEAVTADGNIITANGPAAAISMALTIVRTSLGPAAASSVAAALHGQP